MNRFDDIRPFRDDEVPAVIERLQNSDALIHILIQLQYPVVSRYIDKPLVPLVRRRMARVLRNVKTIADFQQLMFQFVTHVIEKSITEFTWSGLDQLDANKSYFFISNHRDITLDSALLNYVLMQTGMHSAEIAIGDNLLTNPLIADLMRLNKSFVVKRSVPGLKAKLAALTELSEYITDSRKRGNSIWIAQREGRAKDGCDRTDAAIIKMLHIHNRHQKIPFADSMRQLNIVPVAISYEYDPCDVLKASEMLARATDHYVKRENEDVESILRGIALPKGRVHIHFGAPLQGEYHNADEVAAALDEQIVDGYQLFPSNMIAFEQLSPTLPKWEEFARQARQMMPTIDAAELARTANEFSARLSSYPQKLQELILEMYANPLLSKCELHEHGPHQPA
ncbi:MAG: 1-acyl-sn-glycerol-3-phosphate acyltransferase [Gammaproteobacteria bacterium]